MPLRHNMDQMNHCRPQSLLTKQGSPLSGGPHMCYSAQIWADYRRHDGSSRTLRGWMRRWRFWKTLCGRITSTGWLRSAGPHVASDQPAKARMQWAERIPLRGAPGNKLMLPGVWLTTSAVLMLIGSDWYLVVANQKVLAIAVVK